jgi:hypothetical protein
MPDSGVVRGLVEEEFLPPMDCQGSAGIKGNMEGDEAGTELLVMHQRASGRPLWLGRSAVCLLQAAAPLTRLDNVKNQS